MRVGEETEDERHAGGWWNHGVGWIAFQTAQNARERLDRRGAEVVGKLLVQLAEGPENPQLTQYHPQVERIVRTGHGNQGLPNAPDPVLSSAVPDTR